MLTIPSGFITGQVTDLQVCWMVTRRDGVVIRGTEWDRDLTITTGPYAGTYLCKAGITGSNVASNSDLSVDNLEVVGALSSSTSDSSSLFLLDVTAADIEAGLLDNAEAVTFLVNATNPDLYQRVLRNGWLGNTKRNSDGRFQIELRGLTQALSQGIVRTYSIGCDAELGDARCKVDMTPFTFTRTVTVVTDRRNFQIDTNIAGLVIHPGGPVTFNSGFNSGYSMELKSYSSLQVELYLPMPRDISVGDSVTIQFGCDKQQLTCINSYNNILNFRGHGVLVPGDTEVLKVGKR